MIITFRSVIQGAHLMLMISFTWLSKRASKRERSNSWQWRSLYRVWILSLRPQDSSGLGSSPLTYCLVSLTLIVCFSAQKMKGNRRCFKDSSWLWIGHPLRKVSSIWNIRRPTNQLFHLTILNSTQYFKIMMSLIQNIWQQHLPILWMKKVR